MADRQWCRSLFVSPGPAGQVASRQPSLVGEAEVEEPLQVDGGGAVGEPDAVAGGAAVGDAAAGSDEPGEAAFDHGPPASVVVGEVAVAPGAAGFDELGVMGAEAEDAAVCGGGAACSQRAAGVAVPLEDGVVGGGEGRRCARPGRWRCGLCVVDDEVVTTEPAGVGGRPGLDRQAVLAASDAAPRVGLIRRRNRRGPGGGSVRRPSARHRWGRRGRCRR